MIPSGFRRWGMGLGLVLATVASFWVPSALAAQQNRSDSADSANAIPPQDPVEPIVIPGAARVPFGVGENLEYQVKLGVFDVGDGFMRVESLDTIRGYPTYHVSMGIEGGLLFAKVKDRFDSWLDVRRLVSRRFKQDQKEVNYERKRTFEFYPEEWRWERADNDDEGELPTSQPLDDISFVYFVRSLPLEVGREYTFRRYFQEDGNPVVIRVERRDTVEVPAGTFPTIVVRPIIQTDGLFGQGGEAELHFTDDERKLLVYMRSRIPVVGSLSLHLRSITEGTPVVSRRERVRNRGSTDEEHAAGTESDSGGGP